MDKDQIAVVLAEIGVLLELKGENPFKTRAYANAARALEALYEPLVKFIAEDRLGDIKGIGEALQKKITELAATGKLPYYDELKASIPPGLLEIIQIPGVGPKKAKALLDQLGVKSVAELEAACLAGKVAGLEGSAEKTQAKILDGIKFRRTYASRHLLVEAVSVAEPLLAALRQYPDVIRCSSAGSLRRSRETIGDIDLLASSKKPAQVIADFVSEPGIVSVSAKGETKASVILAGGIQADLRVVSDAEYPYALLYFTGHKEHNIILRQRAIQRGLRLNEYGLFKSKEETRQIRSCGLPAAPRGNFTRSSTSRTVRRSCAKTTANLPPPKPVPCRGSSNGPICAARCTTIPTGATAMTLWKKPPSSCTSSAAIIGQSPTIHALLSRRTAWNPRVCASKSRRSRNSTAASGRRRRRVPASHRLRGGHPQGPP